jgi:hypothetical protein
MMLILLCMFIVILAFLGWVNNRPVPIKIPIESAALSAAIAKSFTQTPIPDYVFTYGTFPTLQAFR